MPTAGNDTATTVSNVLKQKYPSEKVVRIAYETDPFLNRIKKNTNFGGASLRVSLVYGAPQGRSVSYSLSRTNRTTSSMAGFTLTRVKDYAHAGIESEAVLAGTGGDNSTLDTLKVTTEGLIYTIRRSLERGVYGDGSGKLGAITNTSFATAVATLADPSQAVNIEVGMKVVLCQPTSPFTPRTGTAVTVNAVDSDAGTVTLSANLSTFTSVAAGDLIVVEGDANGLMKGLAAWLPTTAPTGGDSFFGTDRSVSPTRLAGVRWAASGGDKVDTLMRANVRLNMEGGNPSKRIALLNPLDYGDAAIALGSKAIMEPMKSSTGDFGFDALKLHSPGGVLPLLGSNNVPKGEFFIVQEDTWTLHSLGPAPHIADDDGQMVRRDDTSVDGLMMTARYYAQLGCNAPAYNLHGQF